MERPADPIGPHRVWHAADLAGLDEEVTLHTLRHTRATWLMLTGVDKWEAAGFLGMTVEMLDRVYGRHHPNHLRTDAGAIGSRKGTPILGSAGEGQFWIALSY